MKVKTEDAKCVVFDQYIDAHALFIRDEIPIWNDSRFIHLTVKDKSKIAKNQLILLKYDSEEDLDRDYEFLSNNIDFVDNNLNNIKKINYEINNLIRNFQYEKKYNERIKKLVLHREKIIENKFDENIRDEKNDRPRFSEIKSEYNGIFSYHVDGYENELNTSMNLSDVNLNSYKPNKEIDGNIVGKIVNGRKCIILCDKQVDLKEEFYLKLGTSSNEIKCKLLRSMNGQSVFEAEINDELVDLRVEDIKIKISSCYGVKVSKNSIYEKDGIKGVFILDRKILSFKEVDIKFEGDNFVICDCDELKEDKLHENDAIVLSGKNLYDGKVIY